MSNVQAESLYQHSVYLKVVLSVCFIYPFNEDRKVKSEGLAQKQRSYIYTVHYKTLERISKVK